MFKGLRLKLTFLYLLAALALIILIGAGTFFLINNYFRTSTDLALKYRMSEELQLLGVALPPELAEASQEWLSQRGSQSAQIPTASLNLSDTNEDDRDEGESEVERHEAPESEHYDGELAAIFALPLNSEGQLISNVNLSTPPFTINSSAVSSALVHGSDLRTIELGDHTRVRLLTYRVQGSGAVAVLQLGRTLSDQDRILRQLMFVLLILGGFSTLALAYGSWLLAGRSLLPAQQAWEKQQTFVANASHELRTPLTLMRASAEVGLREMDKDSPQRQLLGDILSETDHMNKLVEDLLLLSRLDSGKLELERSKIAVDELLTDMHRQVGRLADENEITLILDNAVGTIWGDPTRMRQVLLAVLDNALQHTPSGGSIHLESHRLGNQIEIAIIDNGSGVAPADLPHVFERFYRSRDGRVGGSGLGLAISKALVEAQHGQLLLDSRPGEGTFVRIRIPSVD